MTYTTAQCERRQEVENYATSEGITAKKIRGFAAACDYILICAFTLTTGKSMILV